MRSGTLNVPGIVGFGKAAELCRQEMASETERLRGLRDHLNDRLHKGLDEIYINGSMEHRLPHNLNISFAYVEGESLLMGINDVAVSSGSACTSASLEPSYVLKALGAGDDLAHSSIRFGLGRWTTKEEVDYVADKLTHRRDAAARDVAALRDGERRRRPVDDAVGRCTRRRTSGVSGFEAGASCRRGHNGLFKQGHRSLREPAQRRLAAEGRSERRHRAWSARRSAATS